MIGGGAMERRTGVWLAVAMAAGLAAVAAVSRARAAEPAAASADDAFPTVTVTGEMRDHQRWLDGLYFAGNAFSFVLLGGVLVLGVSRRLRDVAEKVSRRPFVAAMVFFVLFSLVTSLASLPLDVVSGYWVPHRFDLSSQSLGAWAWEQTKAVVVGLMIGAPLAALALAVVRRVRRWWLVLWAGTVPLAVLLMLVAPVLLDPVFNDFRPLRDPQLRTEILDLASRAGISGGRVFEVDKSKQTKTMNAYVNGIGPTKRIVLWDTIIAGLDRDELLFVMAHEMGHYVMHHVWKGLAAVLALLLGVFWAAQRIVEAVIQRRGAAWGVRSAADPAAIPLLLLVVGAAVFLLTPALNGMSRHFERASDTFALELTGGNRAGASAFVKLAEGSKVLPDPSPFVKFWRYSHPSLADRIERCRRFVPADARPAPPAVATR